MTREYVTRREWNALAKIADGPDVWHRMGDAGYLDDRERFWFCGRVAHRVLARRRTDVHQSLRGDLQPASGGLSLGTGRHRTGRPAAAGDRGGMLARASAALATATPRFGGRAARAGPGQSADVRDRRLSDPSARCRSTFGTTPKSFANSWPFGRPANLASPIQTESFRPAHGTRSENFSHADVGYRRQRLFGPLCRRAIARPG